ncbi:MAG: hypothetical protein RIQ89_1408, partial [Bacteroidota bacterium]
EGVSIDGNNIIETYTTFKKLAASIRQNPRPVLVEARTFRMRGHEEASGTKYVPPHLFDEWGKKDPVINYENFLLAEGVINEAYIAELRKAIKKDIEDNLSIAFDESIPKVDTAIELADIYQNSTAAIQITANDPTEELRFLDAITQGMDQAMQRHPNLVIMGQDVAEYGGVFKATQGFVEKYGKGRVRNTPLCESAIIGAGFGLSINGYKSIVEMQFADFVTCGFNQIINNLAKSHYRWGQNADVVVRMPTGAAVGAGPFHSQSNEAWFTHTPGLKVVYPAFPADAKGLIAASIEDPNPIMFFEHKALYRSIAGQVPKSYYSIPIGKANLVRSGHQLTIVTYGLAVHWAMEYLENNKNINADLIDLRTLLPWDKDLVMDSVKRTGRVLVFHEDTYTGGFGGEIAAEINEQCFNYLDAPVMRLASLDTPVPMNHDLEWNFLPKDKLDAKIKSLLAY